MRANFVLSGVATGIRRNATMTIALVLSTAIALGFVGAAFLAGFEITKFRSTYEDKLSVEVYLCTNLSHSTQATNRDFARRNHDPLPPFTCAKNAKTTTAQTATVRSALTKDPRVTSFTYINEKQSFSLALKQSPPAQRQVLQHEGVGTFPASFSVKLGDIERDYAPFRLKFNAIQGVDQVNNQVSTFNALLSILDSARWFSVVVAAIVLLASVLLIANTIQVAAAQRRNETSIMRLVGASRWMTELPFMIETVFGTLIGGLVAFGLIWVGKHYVLDDVFARPTQNGVIPNLDINEVLIAGGVGIGIGVALAAATAFVTLRFYVRL